MQARQQSPPRRTSILFSLWAFAFLSYLLRSNISIAQQLMARELALSDLQIGYVFTAFLVGYTISQVPAGVLGDRFGPRTVLAISGACWAATTFLTGFVPGKVVSGLTAALGVLLLIRFLHGCAEAPTYPVAMTAVAEWFKPQNHALINALIFTGSTLGAAFAPPLIAHLMTALGWRATFYVSALFPVLLVLFWRRVTPREAKTHSGAGPSPARANWWHTLLQRNLFFLCLSYFLYCYAISIFVYWLFKYLVDVRHLSIVNSGWATSLPWIAASLAVPILGRVSQRASSRMGIFRGRRLIATICLSIATFLMPIGIYVHAIRLAIGAIALSVALLFSTESSYFSTAIEVGPDDAGASSGLMNLAGNLGGVASTLLVPLLVGWLDWSRALLSASGFAFLAALCWFLIKHSDDEPKEKQL